MGSSRAILNAFLITFLFYSPHLFPTISAKLLPSTQIPVYIVHVKKPQGGSNRSLRVRDLKNWYMSFLPNTTLASGEPRMIYTYHEVIIGFAARLTPEEVEAMESLEGFSRAYPEKEYYASTTYTPTFLGLKGNPSNTLWYDSSMGAGQIIGVIDTGIDPNHPSFNDDGMAPAPTKWRGKCFWGNKSTCNNKLLGAISFFNGAYTDPLDKNGHGTHVASIAAGNFVSNASLNGQAQGTASGMAPRAHLAIYKALHYNLLGRSVGTDSDIYKCIEQAIHDQVDILQMSILLRNYENLRSVISIGSFAAIKKGIVPCAAVGNDGPIPGSLYSEEPWILGVGASTIDRKIVASVLLGNGTELIGESGYQPRSFPSTQMPLAYPAYHLRTPESLGCNLTELNKLNLKNKIVMCFRFDINDEERAENVLKSGGKAMILLNRLKDGHTTPTIANVLPVLHLNYTGSFILADYYRNTINKSNPTTTISFGAAQFGKEPAPAVWESSSRGPTFRNGGIIKPDVIAPGVLILAARPKSTGSMFNFASGTSMATPHVSGVVALLRNKYPDWSPAAIKSAIMTTAYTLNLQGNPIVDEFRGRTASVFALGSGHIDPEAATKPGIIYDLHYYDYVHYMCGYLKINDFVEDVIKAPVNCSQVKVITPEQLNYPSFGVTIGGNTPLVMVNRTVTNVGDAKSIYNVVIKEPKGVRVDVTPKTLQFNQVGEKMSYEVKFSLKGGLPAPYPGHVEEGRLSWDSGKYYASSPIAVTFI